ncbi:MAG: hypothetical protein WCO13_08325 [Bacteroidota bacterium]
MVKINDYESLWITNFSGIDGEEITMPDYDEYKVSKRMLEDYLDIFRGKNSREVDLEMPYPHPFFDNNGVPLLKEKPCIKYILVGEARPPAKKSILNNCNPQGDEANTYFYNINHVGIGRLFGRRNLPTPWLNAPRLNWGCPPFQPCPLNKIQTLLCLASKGVVLLDLFPFAIPFTTSLRKKLMGYGIVKHFWDGDIYSIKTQISALCPYLDSNWDLCLIAPPTLSCHIVGAYDAIDITPCNNGIHNNATFKVISAHRIRGCDHKKVASDTSGNPNAALIRIAF